MFNYSRRPTSTTRVGNVNIGSDFPVRLQSMNNTSTMDTEGSVEQIIRIAGAGADIDRLTAQGVREAVNLGEIRRLVRERGCKIPLVADIHFNPKAAFEAARQVEKVRINPGNFVDPGRVFKQIDYTDEEYRAEIEKIEQTFGPFLDICSEHGTAVRIGVNHGSLSDRIMSRYGDTPEGMVESAMEFLRVAVKRHFNDIVISIKASNTVVMVRTVRLLVAAMEREGMKFPLHLGVTEAGDAEDGRIRSAVGIGTLLAQGIGDTIRVSLSEDPEAEVPVAKELVEYIAARASAPEIKTDPGVKYNHLDPSPRISRRMANIGGGQTPLIPGYDAIEAETIDISTSGGYAPIVAAAKENPDKALVISSSHPDPVGDIKAAVATLEAAGVDNPVIVRLSYDGLPKEKVIIRASADFGALLLDGLLDGIDLRADSLSETDRAELLLGILQAARKRISHTEFVSCPGCGRTLFDLQTTVKRVKEATSHLPGLKIAVMGCIVNGPGEMADADYGYVGAAAGKISLYRGKELLEKNLPSDEALPRLIAILKADGRWVDP